MTGVIEKTTKSQIRTNQKNIIKRSKISVLRDRPVLIFIWKWKVASTKAVFLRFQNDFKWCLETVYQRLSSLRRKGLLQLVIEGHNEGRVWMLTPLGLFTIREHLPALKEEGFASESVSHDILVLAAHLGDWINQTPPSGVFLVTEQQLRRYERDQLPNWIPKDDSHRPDGYWYLPFGESGRTVALEVERSGKGAGPYRKIGEYYNQERGVDSVIWIVDSKQTLERMVNSFCSNLSKYRDIHNFIWLSDFTSFGWHAPFVLGPNRGRNLFTFLTEEFPTTDRPPAPHMPTTTAVQQILDTAVKRRNYSKTVASANSKIP